MWKKSKIPWQSGKTTYKYVNMRNCCRCPAPDLRANSSQDGGAAAEATMPRKSFLFRPQFSRTTSAPLWVFPKDAQVYLLWSWQKVIQKIKYNKIKGQGGELCPNLLLACIEQWAGRIDNTIP